MGNDFLPHSPTLEIREGGIDLLMKIYKQQLHNMGGYICDGPNVNLKRVEVITREVAKMEKDILRMRMKKLQQDKSRRRWVMVLSQYSMQGIPAHYPGPLTLICL